MDGKMIDWTNDEAVVKAAFPEAIIEYGKNGGYRVYGGGFELGWGDCECIAWRYARCSDQVQYFEKLHNPTFVSPAPQELSERCMHWFRLLRRSKVSNRSMASPAPTVETEGEPDVSARYRETNKSYIRGAIAYLAAHTEGETRAYVEVLSCRLGYGHAAYVLTDLTAPQPESAGGIRAESKIITQHIYPPIPDRTHDWIAYREGKEDGLRGYGSTEVEALRELHDEESCHTSRAIVDSPIGELIRALPQSAGGEQDRKAVGTLDWTQKEMNRANKTVEDLSPLGKHTDVTLHCYILHTLVYERQLLAAKLEIETLRELNQTLHETNFRQAATINEIQGFRQSLAEDLLNMFGYTSMEQMENAPSLRELVKAALLAHEYVEAELASLRAAQPQPVDESNPYLYTMRPKPVTALQWTGENPEEVRKVFGFLPEYLRDKGVRTGDYLIKSAGGGLFWSMGSESFADRYTRAARPVDAGEGFEAWWIPQVEATEQKPTPEEEGFARAGYEAGKASRTPEAGGEESRRFSHVAHCEICQATWGANGYVSHCIGKYRGHDPNGRQQITVTPWDAYWIAKDKSLASPAEAPTGGK